MQSHQFRVHTVTECGSCGKLLIIKTRESVAATSHEIMNEYKLHISAHPSCKEWHDELPSLSDMKGCMKGEPMHDWCADSSCVKCNARLKRQKREIDL